MSGRLRIAGAPVSWGVIEVPGWGYQMPAERVLREAASIGLGAIEAGPAGFLPEDPGRARELLAGYGLRLVGGFVPAVLHRPELREEQLSFVGRRAGYLSAAGADTLVLAAAAGTEGYAEREELDESGWRELFEGLRRAEELCSRHGLTLALHPHYGTVVETDRELRRFLDGCGTWLCLDTGHLAIGGSDPAAVAEEAADRVVHAHLKDVDYGLARRLGAGELGFREAALGGAFRPLGEGDVDLGRVVEALEGAGYRGWYVLEQDTVVQEEPAEGGGPVKDVRRSLGYLRGLLDGKG